MKKPRVHPMILAACLFAAVLLVFFAARNGLREPVAFQELPSVEANASGRININTATLEELQTLPGIGLEFARRIVAYREENGPFRSVGELANVEGIGETRLEALWDLVTAGG